MGTSENNSKAQMTNDEEGFDHTECLEQIRQANRFLNHGQIVFNTDAQEKFEEACSDSEEGDKEQSKTKCNELLYEAPITIKALARALLALISMSNRKVAKEHLEKMGELHERMNKDGTWDWEGAEIIAENLKDFLKTKFGIE